MLDKKTFERNKPLVDAVNLAASRARVAWFAFLSLSAYLAIVVGNTTYRDLFLESPAKLPIIDVELPLFGFFWIAPFLYVVVHLALLTDFYLLAKRVGKLREAVGEEGSWDDWTVRLDPFCFVQVSPGSGHPAALAFLLGAMVRLTVVGAPLAVLLMLQWRFVGYHHQATTIWHQLMLVADVILLVTVWTFTGSPSHQSAMGAEDPPLAAAMTWTALTALLAASLFVLVVPRNADEWQDKLIANIAPLRGFGRNLVLPEFKLDTGGERKEKLPSFRGRDLRFAELPHAVLDKADLRHAKLHGANLDSAQLHGAELLQAQLHGANLSRAALHGANLSHAWLYGANLLAAELHGAELFGAHFEAADLEMAELRGADLAWAKLSGANLGAADLTAANLRGAQLYGANLGLGSFFPYGLRAAKLNGADLRDAALWRAKPGDYKGQTLDARGINPYRPNDLEKLRQELVENVTESISDPSLKGRVLERLSVIGEPPQETEQDLVVIAAWIALARESPSPGRFTDALVQAACNEEGAPWAARRLLGRSHSFRRVPTAANFDIKN